ncbi:helix-turn-helix transcriptional regulator [Streptococcus pyogenes]|uniref:helix-turn-helix transcriptional regulator n=1 Tax=Streptococcus pyogenes TaxID=1314 RepID=UPI0010A1F29E|nr:helix-turn-helix domain-containing protein [Streptococcus pyogenes]VGV41640.1 AlpA family transcriptional regulator [Streptococcus pyogenes]VGV60654.1 AlpA family transcriptional regulator [Streptococcus pyogenes]VGW10790.1 AlpA family transcriptional regulator [Streptococcus pyogenes]VHC07698.1 AlpA family transcriptional regulator [Streptococcus pyogenes]VHC60227.1 AlpA family transcriptional regulator [Streptococcus pyogenes]
MQVILPEEQTKEIQLMISELIKSEVKNARESVGADSPFLNKKQTCGYLGISNNTLDLWISIGLPYIKIGKSIRFNKDSVNQWMARLEISA